MHSGPTMAPCPVPSFEPELATLWRSAFQDEARSLKPMSIDLRLQVHYTNKDSSGVAHNIDFHGVTGPGTFRVTLDTSPAIDRYNDDFFFECFNCMNSFIDRTLKVAVLQRCWPKKTRRKSAFSS